MNEDDHIRKLLADVKAGEKGWRKALATAQGSFSKRLAEENLRRLLVLRQTLLTQLNSLDAGRQQVIEAAVETGIITSDVSDSVSEYLLGRSNPDS